MDRRTRVRVLSVIVILSLVAVGFQAVTAESDPGATGSTATPGAAPSQNTLITVQSYGWFDRNNGEAFIVTPAGERVWTFDPPNSRVFDGELLDSGNVLLSIATAVPNDDCPEAYQDTSRYADHCVRNRVIEINRDTNEIVWEYAWTDAFIHWHEVHDADRLPSGETAIVDMGNDRAFTVNRNGEITWEWRAREHIGPGTAFWETHVPEDERSALQPSGPEDDWTHMNDIDRLEGGTFQLSIRNFDVVISVDPETDEIVEVVGRPGATDVMHEQHNPNRLGEPGTLLVADSENDRVVEIDPADDSRVWRYAGGTDPLQWPRDADRLPNGHTMIVDSRNFRVLQINRSSEVVWEHDLAGDRGIVYDADRVGLPEEPGDVPSGQQLSDGGGASPLTDVRATIESWAGFVVPPWMGLGEIGIALVGLAAGVVLLVDGGHVYLRNRE